MTKHVIVPQEELDKLLAARKALHTTLAQQHNSLELTMELIGVSNTLYSMATRKWPEVKGDEQ